MDEARDGYDGPSWLRSHGKAENMSNHYRVLIAVIAAEPEQLHLFLRALRSNSWSGVLPEKHRGGTLRGLAAWRVMTAAGVFGSTDSVDRWEFSEPTAAEQFSVMMQAAACEGFTGEGPDGSIGVVGAAARCAPHPGITLKDSGNAASRITLPGFDQGRDVTLFLRVIGSRAERNYVAGTHGRNRNRFLIAFDPSCEYHHQIAAKCRIQAIGGGWLQFDSRSRPVNISDSSTQFGEEPDRDLTGRVLQAALPAFSVSNGFCSV